MSSINAPKMLYYTFIFNLPPNNVFVLFCLFFSSISCMLQQFLCFKRVEIVLCVFFFCSLLRVFIAFTLSLFLYDTRLVEHLSYVQYLSFKFEMVAKFIIHLPEGDTHSLSLFFPLSLSLFLVFFCVQAFFPFCTIKYTSTVAIFAFSWRNNLLEAKQSNPKNLKWHCSQAIYSTSR